MTSPTPGSALDAALDKLLATDLVLTAEVDDLRAAVTSIEAWIAQHSDAAKPPATPTPLPRTVGVTEPTAANTGLNGSVSGPRIRHDGDLICSAGEVYVDIDVVNGHVVLAPNCTVRRVTATGRLSGGTYYSAIFWGYNADGALVEDCVARPSKATARVSLNGFGWSGKGYTARWNDVSGVTDLFHGAGDDMTIEANYGHDYRFDNVDPDQSGGWCHPDAVQSLGGARLRIVGNSWSMNFDSELSEGVAELQANPWYRDKWGGGFGNGITLTLSANIKAWVVAQNWFRGGEVQVQLPKKARGFDTGNDGTLWGNKVFVQTCNAWHGGTSATSKHHFRQDSGTGLVTTNTSQPNIAAETGKVLPGTYQPLSVKSPA